ncbi:RIKEN cDNA 5430416O09 [Mus musculus]|uniref:Uncharacterized protein n=1 Tax=Mus musculus TaxID=10090 RepID=Q9D3L1_MOUSE|nr:RIKEN cDNA 5430416O09 gene [Mus musculus]AAI47346.1 RIKEN cDNA 5430416O09 gene [Mus musculus]EDL02445.1 RIKEN cDNA 5430416O09 [Mus musculus]BAB30689.1 unnamed protein product [Mus musculus]BAC26908.1 unnamed protein product [Mus musculus]
MTHTPKTQSAAPDVASPWPRFTRRRRSSRGRLSNPGHCRGPRTSGLLCEVGNSLDIYSASGSDPSAPSISSVWCLTPPSSPSVSFYVSQTSCLPPFWLALPSLPGELRCQDQV